MARLLRLRGSPIERVDLELLLWSGLFDSGWYGVTYGDQLGERQPIAHYAVEGATLGFDPNRWFSSANYLRRHPEAGAAGRLPLAHFIAAILESGLDPRQRDDVMRHLQRSSALPGSDHRPAKPAFAVSSRMGAREEAMIAESGLFDPGWYVATYPEVLTSTLSPLGHFLAIGAFEGKDPGPAFSTAGYLLDNSDVAQAGTHPLLHFLQHGRVEGRAPGRLRRRLPDLFPAAIRIGNAEYGPVAQLLRYDGPAAAPSGASLCVHVHLFYPEDAEGMVDALQNIAGPFTLLVSIGENQSEETWQEFFETAVGPEVSVTVRCVPNRGRDVMPWLVAFQPDIRRHDLFLHVHTKRSPHRRNHRDWGRFLLHCALGSVGSVAEIRSLFDVEPTLGLAYPPYFPSLNAQPNWGENQARCAELLKQIGASVPADCPDYPAGSFFWARPAALEPLFDIGLSASDFDLELGQSDGTLAHAVERLVGVAPRIAGYSTRCVGMDVAFNMTRDFPLTRRAPPTVRPRRRVVGSSIPGDLRIAVCTATIGTAEPAGCINKQHGVHYYCLTSDLSSNHPEDYRSIKMVLPRLHKSVSPAAFAKTHLASYFNGYDIVFWHAPTVAFAGDLMDYITVLNSSSCDVGLIYDPFAIDIATGADMAVASNAGARPAVVAQLERYRTMSALDGSRLYEVSFLGVRPKVPAVQSFLASWWQEINAAPEPEALGLPFAVWRSGVRVAPLLPDGRSPRDHVDFAVMAPDHPDRAEILSWLASEAGILRS